MRDVARGRLVGYIGWKDLLRIRSKSQAEESQRVVFYRVR
jgi:CIC family chloride channel protein